MDKKELRDRINHVDTLLGSRTIAFLIGNGFVMTAFSNSSNTFDNNTLCFLGLTIALIWFFKGWQTRQSITGLHLLFITNFPDDEINQTVFKKVWWKRKFFGTVLGTTELMSFWLPFTILLAWAVVSLNIWFING